MESNSVELVEDAVRTLRTFQEAAGIAGFAWYLHAGTLLGAVRDGNFCPGDADDIDVAVLAEDWDRVGYLTDGGLWFREMGRFIYKERVEGVKLELHGSAVHVDVSCLRRNPENGERYDLGTLALNGGEKTYVANVYPGRHFRGYPPFAVINFYGVPCRIPRHAADLCEYRYGQDWKMPVHRDNFDWCAIAPCEAIRTEYYDL